MNQITNYPNSYDAGYEFNYDVWLPGTIVTLCNVPWDSNYRDTVLFDSKEIRDRYITTSSGKIVIDRVTYAKIGRPIKLDIPFSQAIKFNYLRVENPAQPINGDQPTVFYYFIRAAQHSAPNTTEFVIQLDVWQSFIYDVDVKRGYLERGHYALVKGQESVTSDWLATPESMDMGSEYITSDLPASSMYEKRLFDSFDFLITSVNSLTSNPGTLEKPNVDTAPGASIQGRSTATVSYIVRSEVFTQYMSGMSKYPWVATGIIRIVAVPRIPDSMLYNVIPTLKGSNRYPPGPNDNEAYIKGIRVTNGANIYTYSSWYARGAIDKAMEIAGTPYSWMNKFKTAPYCLIYMCDNAGRELVLNPYYLRSNNVEFDTFTSLMPTSEQIRLVVKNYLTKGPIDETALIINGFPTIPTVNDNAMIAQASQAHGLANARAAASWAQQRAMASNNTSYDNATASINAGWDSGVVSRNADIAQTTLNNTTAQQSLLNNSITGTLSSISSGGAMGGGVGAGLGAVAGLTSAGGSYLNHSTQEAHNNQSLNIRNNAGVDQANISRNLGSSIRDNNKALADFATKGDYAQAIASIDAKVQDMQMTQPSLAGQYGGELALWLMNRMKIAGVIKHITRENMMRIGEYWARYGYAANRFVSVEALKLMTHVTYWKMQDVAIKPKVGISEEFLNALRGIFEKGVSIYDKPDNIYDINVTVNKVR